MKILVISNLYPPYSVGGYELGCRDVVDGLRARGHDVRVLTGMPAGEKPVDDGHIYRRLTVNADWTANEGVARYLPRLTRMEMRNPRVLNQVFAEFRPDIIYIWNLLRTSVRLAFRAQTLGVPVAYFVSDHWLARWEAEHWDSWYEFWNHAPDSKARRIAGKAGRAAVRAAGLLPPADRLDLSHVHFASDYLRREAERWNVPIRDPQVIHWGVDPSVFAEGERPERPVRLIFAGQIRRHKGVHTVIDALGSIVGRGLAGPLSLSIVGGTIQPEYEMELKQRVAALGLEDRVRFTGPHPRTELPRLYIEHDILVFPSIWHEPFSIALVEGMATGLPVVGTLTGGSPEILRDGVNGVAFPPEDSTSCAEALVTLANDRALRLRLGAEARQTVLSEFTSDVMVDKIERALVEAVRV